MSLRHLFRRLVRQPAFTFVAIFTLAVGIGANSAIFAVINGVILKPLPFPHGDGLIDVDHAAPGVNLPEAGIAPFLSETYRAESRSFEDIAIWRMRTSSLTQLGDPEQLVTLYVSAPFLPLLQVRPAMGRVFSQADDTTGNPETVIVTYSFWRSKLGSDPAAIGRRIVLDSRAREIIGVLPANFQFLDFEPAFLLPLQIDPASIVLGQFDYKAIARLKPGVTMAQASADVARMIPIALHRYPPQAGYTEKAFEDVRLAPIVRPLKQSFLGDVGTILWVLMGTVGIVLLIACANVANLMLVRAQGRQHELAIRAALGASWAQLMRELLLESLALGLAGGVAGAGLAYGGVQLLHFLAPGNLPRLHEISMDAPALLFTFAISIFAGVMFGMLPALKYAAPKVIMALRAGGRSMSQSRERQHARNTLVIVQVALALVLLISSGLMIRTFFAMRRVDPGFSRPDQLQFFSVFIPPSAVKDPAAVVRMERDILDKVSSVPGVESAAIENNPPMTGSRPLDQVYVKDKVYPDNVTPPLRRYRIASPGLFSTMGSRLIAGRDFTWSDIEEKTGYAILTENLARELFGSPQTALGKLVREDPQTPWHEIIGVAENERDDGVDQKAPQTVTYPFVMSTFQGTAPYILRGATFAVRSSRAGSSAFINELSRAVWSVNARLPLSNLRTMDFLYKRSLARTSFALVMLAVAGITALILGVAGIYGVISYSVAQRTREVGIRRALGAQNSQVTAMFVQQALRLAAIGIAAGLAAAFAVMRLMGSLLFAVKPADPLTYATISMALAGAAILASYVPALRATRVDPVEALRSE